MQSIYRNIFLNFIS